MTAETARRKLSAPTMYDPVAVAADDAPFEIACARAATDGADRAAPGALYWAPRRDRVECAIVLGPEEPLGPSLLVAYAAMLGIGDALGALIPPAIPVAFGWPDRILVNGATAGRIRLSADPAAEPGAAASAVPAWMALGLSLAVSAPLRKTSRAVAAYTTLHAEGCGETGAREILESFTRHFLFWVNRWQEEGFAPVKDTWLARAAGYGDNTDLETIGPWSTHTLLRLDADGAIQYTDGDGEKTAALADALLPGGWAPS